MVCGSSYGTNALLSSTRNPLVQRLIRLRTSARHRRQQGQVLLVGPRALREAAALQGSTHESNRGQLPLQVLLLPVPPEVACDARMVGNGTTWEAVVSHALADAGLNWGNSPYLAHAAAVARLADARVLRRIAGLSSFSGPIGVVSLPPARCSEDPTPMQRLLVLSGVSDPGNVGTLLRTALGLGWDGVFFLAGGKSSGDAERSKTGAAHPWPHCADPFGDKALRAAAGAAFRLPIIHGCPEVLGRVLKRHQMTLYVADLLQPRASIGLAISRIFILLVASH